MENQPNNDMQDTREAPSLQSVQSELNALKRKYTRLEKENENIAHLYKQAAALRDFNEKEKETQMRYNQMLRDNSPDEIFLLDTELNILLCTSTAKKDYGDITGVPFLTVSSQKFGYDFTREAEALLHKLVDDYRSPSVDADIYEFNVETGREKKLFYSVKITPALDKTRELFGVVVLVHDNTEIHNANVRAEAANKTKSAFLATMSHEIRTPMNAILGITEIQLQNDSLGQDVKEALGKIYSSGDMLLGIINDILDLSKIESGKLELIIGKYEIASLVSDTAQLNMMRIGSKPIEFELYIDKNMPMFLSGDELRVKQVLNNILSNAFKYTAKGTVKLSVSAAKADDGEKTTLIASVSDTGQGMTKEQVDKLFDEYSRFNAEANRTTEGTGLGMSITRNLIRLMDGEIFIESELGEGSTFTVHIPQGKIGDQVLGAEIAENLCQFRTSSMASLKRVLITRDPMPYGSVLIVDDVETNIYVATGLMVPYGLKIESADSGFAAIEKIKDGNVYDIIFMDHMMPKMDGVEATAKIREMGYTNPIVALTANAVAGQADIFFANGFDDFISKPIDIRQLNNVLNKQIRDKRPPEVVEAARRRAETSDGGQSADNGSQPGVDPKFAEIFARDAKKTISELETIAEKNDYTDENGLRTYIINVHGVKSALANIGKMDLSAMALKLETAGREGKLDLVISKTPDFINSLRAFVEEIEPRKASDAIDAQDEDKALLLEKLLVIKTACEEYDSYAADEAIAELRKKSWSQPTNELLTAISEHLLHSNFDEAIKAAENYSG